MRDRGCGIDGCHKGVKIRARKSFFELGVELVMYFLLNRRSIHRS